MFWNFIDMHYIALGNVLTGVYIIQLTCNTYPMCIQYFCIYLWNWDYKLFIESPMMHQSWGLSLARVMFWNFIDKHYIALGNVLTGVYIIYWNIALIIQVYQYYYKCKLCGLDRHFIDIISKCGLLWRYLYIHPVLTGINMSISYWDIGCGLQPV